MMADDGSLLPAHILLVDDNPADVRLTQEVLREADFAHRLSVATDAEQALQMLRSEASRGGAALPDIVLLDLNLPGMDGRDLLRTLKQDPMLRCIPVVILSTSRAPKDILGCYRAHANCYVAKPVDLDEFVSFAAALRDFWLRLVYLPGALIQEVTGV